MALMQCPECDVEVSDKAAQCPKCGCPIAQRVPAPSDNEKAVETTGPDQTVYLPIIPPKKFLAGSAFVYLCLLAFAGWLLFVKLPEHAPPKGLRDGLEKALTGEKFLAAEDMQKAQGGAALLAIIGVLGLMTSFQEMGRALMCETCGMQVLARRKVLGRFACERCGTVLAGKAKATCMLIINASVLALIGVIAVTGVVSSQAEKSKRKERRKAEKKRKQNEGERREQWLATSKRKVEAWIHGARSTDALVATLHSCTHSSGREPHLGPNSDVQRSGDKLVCTFELMWKGGILRGQYKTVVVWRFSMNGHIDAVVTEDNAMVSVTAKNKKRLNTWFRDKAFKNLRSR